ncbi:MAG: hypothetical protein KDC98_20300, partial [Planctomycetes bacterium]|nr:hypothetical protein [Planctomycetota bacterium]
PDAPSPIRYVAQPANGGRIELTASNGFFDRCFEAQGSTTSPDGERQLIRQQFERLVRRGDGGGTARWHLWCATPGVARLTLFAAVPEADAGSVIEVQLGGQTQRLQLETSDGAAPQAKALEFVVAAPGVVTIAVACPDAARPSPETGLRVIEVAGNAVLGASLLRARFRPAAVHVRYFAPDGCEAPDLWVFETRATTPASSYSPMTAPFGYFGTSFKGGKVEPGSGFNFSMWIAGRDADAPPIAAMESLLGTGLPDAVYSTFGHEGSGVKFRSAVAYANGAERVIQALRVSSADGHRTFYGYYFDEVAARWRLYASGQVTEKEGARRRGDGGVIDSTGSFCEVPGAPNRERSGDVRRTILRRGWFRGSDGRFHLAQLEPGGGGRGAGRRQRRAEPSGDNLAGLRTSDVAYAADYAEHGWVVQSTGGLEHRLRDSPIGERPTPRPDMALPDYLAADKVTRLCEVPVTFGQITVDEVTAKSAVVHCPLLATGPGSRAVLYYGPVDCRTVCPAGASLPPTEVVGNSAALRQMYASERVWQRATEARPVAVGDNVFALTGLTAGTTYHCRLFVAHEDGQSWDGSS